MSGKFLTHISPTIRWILLPFSCILAPVIASILIGLIYWIVLHIDWGVYVPGLAEIGWSIYVTITKLIKEIVQSFAIGFSFAQVALYLAPNHTKIVMLIIRILGVIAIGAVSSYVYSHNLFSILHLINVIMALIGLLYITSEEKYIINKEITN